MTVINSYDKPAIEIKFGNYLFGQKVVSTKPKLKKTIITLAEPVDGKTEWEFRFTDMLEVGVEELTEEELAAREVENLAERKRFFVLQVKKFVTDAKASLEKAEAMQAERREKGWGLLDHYVMDHLLSAWSEGDVAREIDAVFSSAADGTFHLHEGECDYTWTEGESGGSRSCKIKSVYDDYAVAVHITNRMIHRLTAFALQMRVLSRSTSITSNLCDDMKVTAVASFVNSLQYAAHGLAEVQLPSRY